MGPRAPKKLYGKSPSLRLTAARELTLIPSDTPKSHWEVSTAEWFINLAGATPAKIVVS